MNKILRMNNHVGRESACGQEMGNNEFSWSGLVITTHEFTLSHYVTRFYKIDPNRTSGKIKLTPPVENHVQMQNNAMFRIICLRIGHALFKFRFAASGLVFRGGQCVFFFFSIYLNREGSISKAVLIKTSSWY